MITTTTERTERRTGTDEFFIQAAGWAIRTTFRALWAVKFSLGYLFWAAILIQGGTMGTILAMIWLGWPFLFRKTRPYGVFVLDYNHWKEKRRQRNEVLAGNEWLRNCNLVSGSDESIYNVTMVEDKTKATITFWSGIAGMDHQRIKDAASKYKAHHDAVRLTFEDLGSGALRVEYLKKDPLAGSRGVAQNQGVKARVARLEDGTDGYIDLEDASHIAIQGMTRSGKSVLCYGLLAQLAGVDQVQVWGVDPNRVLLAPFAKDSGDRIVLGSRKEELEATLDLLERFTKAMDERLVQLESKSIDKFEHFTAETPIMLMVLEEYPALVRQMDIYDKDKKAGERIGTKAKGMVARLVSEGAKVGIRVIIIAQRADAEILDGPTRAQLGTRITMRVDNASAIGMLHSDLDPEIAEAVKKFSQGRFLLEQHGQRWIAQADYIGEYGAYLQRVGDALQAQGK